MNTNAARIEEVDAPGEGDEERIPRKESPIAKALGAMITSGDRELAALAWARIDRAVDEAGGVLPAARKLGVAHRTLCRWRAARGA